MKKINNCDEGGYKKVQVKMLGDFKPKCAACKDLMESCHFDANALHDKVEAWMNGDKSVLEKAMPPSEKTKDDEPPASNAGDEDAKMSEAESREAAHAWLKTLEPMITLLTPGSYGKRVPYRCNVCKSKKWPEGRVGELDHMRFGSVKNFLKQHFSSQTHIDNVNKRKEKPDENKVKCEGLCVSSPMAGKLYAHRDDFNVWAMVANFEGCAKHKYWRDANSNMWFVRSSSCLGDCSPLPGAEQPVCNTCLQLGGSHSVAWFSRKSAEVAFTFFDSDLRAEVSLKTSFA